MANKVRYGLSKLYRAKLTRGEDGTITYGTPKRLRGAVSFSLTPEGSDATDFYADDGAYYTIEGTNGGYTGELVVAHLDDTDRQELLGETVYDGIQYESTEDKPPEYAWIMEMQGDFDPIAFCFFCGKASRVALNANTKGESVEVDTDTLSIRFIGAELPVGEDVTKSLICAHMEKSEANAAKYAAFFSAVPVPPTTA